MWAELQCVQRDHRLDVNPAPGFTPVRLKLAVTHMRSFVHGYTAYESFELPTRTWATQQVLDEQQTEAHKTCQIIHDTSIAVDSFAVLKRECEEMLTSSVHASDRDDGLYWWHRSTSEAEESLSAASESASVASASTLGFSTAEAAASERAQRRRALRQREPIQHQDVVDFQETNITVQISPLISLQFILEPTDQSVDQHENEERSELAHELVAQAKSIVQVASLCLCAKFTHNSFAARH